MEGSKGDFKHYFVIPTLAAGARNLQGPGDRVCLPFRTSGHEHAYGEDGLYRPGSRGRTGAKPGCREGKGWPSECQGQGEEAGQTQESSRSRQNSLSQAHRRVLGRDFRPTRHCGATTARRAVSSLAKNPRARASLSASEHAAGWGGFQSVKNKCYWQSSCRIDANRESR